MDKLIQTSLFQNKSFRLPGIGILSVITNSAETDFINLTIKSPLHTIIFTEEQQEANLFNKFSSTSEFVTTSLEETGTFHLDGVGTFTKKDGKIRFLGVALSREFIQPVKAERVVKNAVHRKAAPVAQHIAKSTIATSIPIVEEKIAQQQITKKKSYWWVWSIGLGIAAAAMIAIYFAQNPSHIPSFGNTNTINAAPANTDSHHEIK
ncbi:MAG TPA: hypothetical protein VK705_01795 [Ferruginibacter sp.]|jgi:hypothetical protein|nr:hypothetical protein [Ferruginibacter sp.]